MTSSQVAQGSESERTATRSQTLQSPESDVTALGGPKHALGETANTYIVCEPTLVSLVPVSRQLHLLGLGHA